MSRSEAFIQLHSFTRLVSHPRLHNPCANTRFSRVLQHSLWKQARVHRILEVSAIQRLSSLLQLRLAYPASANSVRTKHCIILTSHIVIVTLNSQDGDLSRSFVLSRDRPNIKIGRASKSGEARFKAQPNNGWIESPIMSRDHALLMMGGSSPIPLLLRDTGSTHGTFINDERLVPNRDNVLKTMDKLSFGVPVTSGRGKLAYDSPN